MLITTSGGMILKGQGVRIERKLETGQRKRRVQEATTCSVRTIDLETEESSNAALKEKSKLCARGDDSTVWAGVKGLKRRVCKEQKS